MLHTARRGREGIDKLKKKHFVKSYCKKQKIYYYSKVCSERTKNHQKDEDVEVGGIIPFRESISGLNPGLFLERFLALLDPNNPNFFQRPKREAKKNNLHNPKTTVYFENSKVGVNFVSLMMPKMCEAFGLERRFTNCNIRPTSIRLLKRAGIEDRAIAAVSGHKDLKTLG